MGEAEVDGGACGVALGGQVGEDDLESEGAEGKVEGCVGEGEGLVGEFGDVGGEDIGWTFDVEGCGLAGGEDVGDVPVFHAVVRGCGTFPVVRGAIDEGYAAALTHFELWGGG